LKQPATTLSRMPSRVPKAIVYDIDGTIITSDAQLHPRTLRALASARAAGITLVAATGRPFPVVGAPGEPADWIIGGNGTGVLERASGIVHHEATFPIDIAFDVVRIVRALVPGTTVSIVSDVDAVWETGFESITPVDAQPGRVVPDALACAGSTVGKLVALHLDHSVSALAALLAPHMPAGLAAQALGFGAVEIGLAGVDKSTALQWLAGHLGLDRGEVWAFGDNINDREMLEWAGRGIAMGNADDDTKAIADHITATNDDHGVALVIEALLAR
jgi:Cof subfamily protein (haloacid dehalogenase superfamily)